MPAGIQQSGHLDGLLEGLAGKTGIDGPIQRHGSSVSEVLAKIGPSSSPTSPHRRWLEFLDDQGKIRNLAAKGPSVVRHRSVLIKRQPDVTCLYSAGSMLPRSLPATAPSLFSKPRLASCYWVGRMWVNEIQLWSCHHVSPFDATRFRTANCAAGRDTLR